MPDKLKACEIQINAPRYSKVEKFRKKCPDCQKRAYMIASHQEWYGWDITCLSCGRHWQDGEWIPLDFYRNARKDNIDNARKIWKKRNERNG